MDSILDTIKKMLGIPSTDTAFDIDIIVNINSAFMVLNQIGVGPNNTFSISDNTVKWSDFIGSNLYDYSAIKTYIYLKVKQVFDPPTLSFVFTAMDNQITELEYRLRTQTEIKIYFIGNNIVSGTPILGTPELGVI